MSKTFIPRVFVSGLAQLFHCFEVICDICCRNLDQSMQLVSTWALYHGHGWRRGEAVGSERFGPFLKFMAWKWMCMLNSTTCCPAGSVGILLLTVSAFLQLVRVKIASPENLLAFWQSWFQSYFCFHQSSSCKAPAALQSSGLQCWVLGARCFSPSLLRFNT